MFMNNGAQAIQKEKEDLNAWKKVLLYGIRGFVYLQQGLTKANPYVKVALFPILLFIGSYDRLHSTNNEGITYFEMLDKAVDSYGQIFPDYKQPVTSADVKL